MIFATKGVDGWGRPALGAMSLVDIDMAGPRFKNGCKLWPIGTWALKAAFYGDLRKEGRGPAQKPSHRATAILGAGSRGLFPPDHGRISARGDRSRAAAQVLKAPRLERDNHWLDTPVMAMALAEPWAFRRMRRTIGRGLKKFAERRSGGAGALAGRGRGQCRG